MTADSNRFTNAIARFDAANAEDPNVETYNGTDYPKELLYAQRMTAWLDKIAPDASEIVKLAARAQHIRRWTMPRKDYPQGKAGYKQWRTTLAKFHAETAGVIMREVGYDEDAISRVQSLLRKEKLKRDPDVQLLEDVICLVFLENYFADFSKQHEPDKIVDIVRKTWRKMSPRGHEAALALDIPPDARTLVERALAE